MFKWYLHRTPSVPAESHWTIQLRLEASRIELVFQKVFQEITNDVKDNINQIVTLPVQITPAHQFEASTRPA